MEGVVAQINGNPILIHALFRSNPSRSSSPLSLSLPPLSWRKGKVTMSCKQSYLASINEDVKAHLKHAIPVREPLAVYEPMHYLTFAAPWNTAPALCVAACELVGGYRNLALPAASALHLMYAASYSHENLPLQESCRPKSTIHHEYGPNIELLTGASIMSFALEVIAKSDDPAQNISDRIRLVIVEIIRSVGSQGMIYGQYHEIESIQSNGSGLCHVEEIEHVCEKYEGSLYACAATCGAILGGGNVEEIEKMRRYGLYVGKIQGLTRRIRGNDKDLMKLVEDIRGLAIKELKGFDEAKVEAFSSFFLK